jgi:3-hydroxybutyryl-CoA dehydrogenase
VRQPVDQVDGSVQERGHPASVTVVGAGTMGMGIAHAFLLSGSLVTVVEADASRRDAVAGLMESLLRASQARRGGSGSLDAVMERLRVAGPTDSPSVPKLAIEAVPEDPRLKAQVLGEIEARVTENTVVATNTSSISVNELAASLRRPARFVGLHFFNPVPSSSLVEVVRGDATSEEAIRRCAQWVSALGKESVLVADTPGFASTRLGVLLGLEAIRMLEEGVATAADIDRAMRLGYRHPMGPLALTDLVGLDVRLAIAEYLNRRLGDRFEPPDLLRRMVDEGRLGRKVGRGFFDYPTPRPTG